MRIKSTSNLKDLENKARKTSMSSSGKTSQTFATTLTQKHCEMSAYEQEVEELKRGIDEAGDQLEKEPTLANFHKFRELLGQIAKRISAEAYRLNKIGGTPQNPRYYEIITIINSEADQLYKLLLQEQRKHMEITAKVIGIKGLVVNLTT
jgi:uncharacterized protein YaaR (DUF327 family)